MAYHYAPLPPSWVAATCTAVADGDTIRTQASLGLGVELHSQPVRLLGVQAPEIHGDERWQAHEARRRLAHRILTRQIWLHIPGGQRDRYGRWLAWVWLETENALLSVNRWMIDEGLAVEWWPVGWGHRARMPPILVERPRLDPMGSG